MENSLKKLFGGGSEEVTDNNQVENSSEQKKVVDSDSETREDFIYVREVYDDGSVGEWEPLKDAPLDNPEIAREAYREWKKARNLIEIEDNQE